MSETSDRELVWHRPCADSSCAEVAVQDNDVLLRSSERPAEIITLSASEWSALKESIRRGDFPV
ncbi:hypothetical protein AMIS_53780 [Actinoplanes missouriensis 431]|uniref:Uncharacterized protein n=1 Tax=Actinoplanes missouriensis (strain ATCC 14538 / DSM 43046 / CBS 188.64 / JCM 3121 / NBRC 102363 / NCIMB 12654 / NRRL B-3342 / UNCC 431) TaxID=512565 RepID=I0HC61_ACTM4|nr:hypothetical protein AMIS_53780 [Actinoplanes missouriensis 431]